jgi:hypothetical protein
MPRIFISPVAPLLLAGSVALAARTGPPLTSLQAQPAAPVTSAAQAPADPITAPTRPGPDTEHPVISLTGCLVPGKAPGVFLLESARTPAQGSSEPGKTYAITSAASGLNLLKNLNHRVTLSGWETTSPPSALATPSSDATVESRLTGSPATTDGTDERLLPTFTASRVTAIADACRPTRP